MTRANRAAHRRWWWFLAVPAALLAVWIGYDLVAPGTHDLRDFDGHEVGRIETAMWRSYYEHHPARLFWQLTGLLRRQYHAPFWRASLGAYHAARAAVLFQKGNGSAEYLLALPDLESFYGLIRQGSSTPFDVRKAAAIELEWWIIHRERDQRPPGDLDRSLAELQATLYEQPASRFAEHARLRAEAMLLRDKRAAEGGVSEADWSTIGGLLDRSWWSLQNAVQVTTAP